MSARRALVVLVLAAALLPGRSAGQMARPAVFGVPGPEALFTDGQTQEVRLRVNADDWASLKAHYLENTYYPADLVWRGATVRNVAIRSRGTGSRSPVKPGLKVSFDRYVKGQTFLGLSSLVLRNNTQDASNMHERLSMQVFHGLGLPAPRESYARFYVNEEYQGLYTIVESIDDRFLARYFPATDGYLFSFDYPAGAAPFYFEDRGREVARYVPQPFKPETHESNPRGEVLVDMVQAVNDSTDARFEEEVGRYLDLDAVVRHVAIESCLVDDDGVLGNWGMNNIYLYRLADDTRFSLLVWDKSDTFLAGRELSIWHGLADVPAEQRNRLMSRAVAVPRLRSVYLDTLDACVTRFFDPDPVTGVSWLQAEIERQYTQIRDAARADENKPYSNEQFEDAVAFLREFAVRRGPYLRRAVAGARRGE